MVRVSEGLQALPVVLRTHTSGQVWTSGIALGVSLAVVLFGLPPRTEVVAHEPRAAPTAVVESPPATQPSVEVVLSPVSEEPPPSAPVAAPTGVVAPPTEPPVAAGPLPPFDAQPTALPQPGVIFLADASLSVPGRSEADLAGALATARGIEGTVITGDLSDPGTCDQVPRGSLVVTSFGVGPAVRACLGELGTTLLGFDDGPSDPEAGVASTNPGSSAALVATAEWMLATGVGGERVAIVSTDRTRTYVESALEDVARAGLEVETTVYVPEALDREAELAAAVLDLARSGIATVVLAAPVHVQRRWVLKANLVSPGVQYVVVDTRDSILDEQYPPGFEGAMAHSVVRVPWSNRASGDDPRQAGCRADWAAAAPPGALNEAEVGRAFAWCQHLDLAADLLAGLAVGENFMDRLRATTVQPLLTAAFPWQAEEGTPGTRTSLVWSAACVCWAPSGGPGPGAQL